jgi:adenylate cyclase
VKLASDAAVPLGTSLLLSLGASLVVMLAWQLGWLQNAEFAVYDMFVRWQGAANAADPRFVLVLQGEQDIKALTFPLPDVTLARLIDRIESGVPAVIGLDIYRDVPVPQDGSGLPQLNTALAGTPEAPRKNVVGIFALGNAANPFAIAPPPALAPHAARIGFNSLPYDNNAVRRAYVNFVFKQNDGRPEVAYYSFATSLTLAYLRQHGVAPSLKDGLIALGHTVIPPLGKSEGGYVREGVDGYQFLIDFRGPRHFTSLSVSDALNADPSLFKDKIVLIGSDAESSNDQHDTPIAPLTPGVEIHAQIINQLLRAGLEGVTPRTGAGFWPNAAILLLGGLGGGAMAFFLRSYIAFAAAGVAAFGALLLGGWLLFIHGLWIMIVAPAVALGIATGLVKAYAVSHEEAQRSQLMDLFSRHMSPAVAERLWKQRELFAKGGRPAAQRLVVTVLFTDLKNYSTISETMTPAELIDWINECTHRLARHVDANGGIINNYMGDGMMAVFGAPAPRLTEAEQKEDATNAVRCALSMATEMKIMNAEWRKQGKPTPGLRVGIYTGVAMAGTLGSDDHLAYSIIGDTVNTASRLESVDKEGLMTGATGDCRILIGESTYHFIDGIFPARYVGEVNLKGKEAITKVYKVLDRPEELEQTFTAQT